MFRFHVRGWLYVMQSFERCLVNGVPAWFRVGVSPLILPKRIRTSPASFLVPFSWDA